VVVAVLVSVTTVFVVKAVLVEAAVRELCSTEYSKNEIPPNVMTSITKTARATSFTVINLVYDRERYLYD